MRLLDGSTLLLKVANFAKAREPASFYAPGFCALVLAVIGAIQSRPVMSGALLLVSALLSRVGAVSARLRSQDPKRAQADRQGLKEAIAVVLASIAAMAILLGLFLM